jgi:hypothetical protein
MPPPIDEPIAIGECIHKSKRNGHRFGYMVQIRSFGRLKHIQGEQRIDAAQGLLFQS